MFETILHNFERNSDFIQEVWACKIEVCTLLTLMNFLDHSFYLRVLWSGRVNKIVTGLLWIKLFVAEVEGFVVFFYEVFQACIVDFIIEVRVDSPLVVEIEKPEDISSLNHYHTLESKFAEMQKILVFIEQNFLVNFLEEDAAITRVSFTVADDLSVSLREN